MVLGLQSDNEIQLALGKFLEEHRGIPRVNARLTPWRAIAELPQHARYQEITEAVRRPTRILVCPQRRRPSRSRVACSISWRIRLQRQTRISPSAVTTTRLPRAIQKAAAELILKGAHRVADRRLGDE